MATNNRVFYAVNALGFAAEGTSGYLSASGVQSVGLNTTFNLEQVFQLGQLDLYQNVENIPDIEMTVEKVLDGTALLQHLATQNATAATLNGRYSTERSNAILAYWNDTLSSATGQFLGAVSMSGLYVSSMSLTLPVEGNGTESVTFVGNSKIWSTGQVDQFGVTGSGIFHFDPGEQNTGSPAAASGVTRRQHINMSGCIWPLEIPGMVVHTGAITFGGSNRRTGDAYATHIQSVNVSVDLGRTELFELGHKGPYHRFADFPTEVTCGIEIIETEFGDYINASESTSLSNQVIYVEIDDGANPGTIINLGNKNKLSSITSTGGDTGGGNRTSTYNYSNFNTYAVTDETSDPKTLAGPGVVAPP